MVPKPLQNAQRTSAYFSSCRFHKQACPSLVYIRTNGGLTLFVSVLRNSYFYRIFIYFGSCNDAYTRITVCVGTQDAMILL